jgi:hypothetical protein
MKARVLGAFGLLAMSGLVGCESIPNPVEEFGERVGPFVRFEFPGAIGTPESEVLVIFQMPTRIGEDVEIDFTLGGSARFGEDFIVLDRAGNVRTDVTPAGGTARIPSAATQPVFGRDTLRIFLPPDAEDGRLLDIEITAARTVSGSPVEAGFIDAYRRFRLSIEGFVDIPIGTYVGERTGDFGTGAAEVTITKPSQPIQVGGESFQFVVSDFTGNAGVFGVAVPWAFSVTSGGTVFAARSSHTFGIVTSSTIGTYDFTTRTLDFDVILTCCEQVGARWRLVVSQP